jgi:toxin ParE1/3/4
VCARRDVEATIACYMREAEAQAALRFIVALESTYQVISRPPVAGYPRYDDELALPGVRSRRLNRFPYLVFYVERDDHIDIWRVLHAQRDIPAWLQEPKS